MSTKLLTIIIPAYNEAKVLPKVLPELLSYSKIQHWDVIIVDDGSIDESTKILADYADTKNLKVLHHKLNRGYGGAIKTGIFEANSKYIITLDADGQHYIQDVDRLLYYIIENDADMVVGSRKGQKSSSKYRSLGKWIIRSIAKILMHVPIYDLNSGMKIYRTDLAKRYIGLYPNSMAFSDIITLVFINQKHLVLEHPIRIRERLGGKSTIGVQTSFQTIMEIVNILTLFQPLKIFLPISFFCMVPGVVWGLYIFFQGKGVSVGSSLLITMAILSFLLGLIAEQLATIRKSISSK